MSNIDIMNFWIDSANNDYETMLILFKNKRYSWCLFIGHLTIEKLLKALFAKNHKDNPYAPRSHDLNYLCNKNNLILTEKQDVLLEEITRFNINCRYDNYKKSFQSMCTKEYTEQKLVNIKEIVEWLKKLLQE